ncbi:MAG: hypothetical protein QOE90_161 [Thermoplasmata archaeon]|jgi:hypothetical protein|nr:hypothetical protein [Thermoplasmata archaeon]
MRSILLVAAALAVTLVALPGHAGTAPCYTTSEPTQAFAVNGQLYYAVVDQHGAPDLYVYQETNGIDGLQRHDDRVDDLGSCRDGTPGDTWAFSLV